MKKLLLILLTIAIGSTSFCQSLSLQDAINIALQKNLDLQLLKNNVEIGSINNYIGIAGGLPVVSAQAADNEQKTNVHQQLNS